MVPLFALAHCFHHLVTALAVPLLPFIRDEFALDYTRAGFVISAFSLVYGLTQIPAGWLADRIGPRLLITVGICGVAVAGLLIGLSNSYILLLIFLVLMGLMGGGYHPASANMVSASVAPEHRGSALGVHMVGGSVSYFLVPLIAAGFAVAWGWRGTFIALSIPTIALGIALHIVLRRQVLSKKTKSTTFSSQVEAPATPDHRHRLVTLLILSTFNQALIISVISFIPLFLVDYFGVSKEIAAASISLPYFMGLWAGPLGGYLSDRFGRIAIILSVCALGGIAIYLLPRAPYGIGIGIILAITGICLYINSTASQAYIVDQTSERRRSTVLGIFFFGNMEGSGVLTPVLGYLSDQMGFQFSFTIAGIALLAMTLAGAISLRLIRK